MLDDRDLMFLSKDCKSESRKIKLFGDFFDQLNNVMSVVPDEVMELANGEIIRKRIII